MHLPNFLEAKKRNQEIEFKEVTIPTSKIFNGKKYFLKTYGCQMNVHDSELIKSMVENIGYEEVDTLEESDLAILNTCAIRENAHDKVFGFLGRCKHLKKIKPLTVVLCGCMAQEESVVNTIHEKYKFIDLVIGTHNLNELSTYLLNNTHDIEVYSDICDVREGLTYKRDSHITAWINIMYGCDKFCTYCIVPYTRGQQRSRKHADILKEINDLVLNGYQEITLLGQNVNAYGKDRDDEIDFAQLLELVSKTKIKRIRFVTSHPWDFTDEMIKVIKENKNIMPYIHLPIQSGSNRILKLMGRRYTIDEYKELFNKLKKEIKGCAISTDIIVGFPNETKEDFQQTLDIVNYCQFDGAYTFIYSPRENTPAAKLDDKISLKEKEERLSKLNELVNHYSNLNNQHLLNKEVSVLIEGISEKDNQKLYGYTDTMKLVNIVGSKDLIGQIVKVKITDAKSFSLDGKAV